MARRRFFVEAVRGGMAELRGEEARHLTRVLRAEAGQRYEISDGRAAYLAEIVEARGERAVFRVLEPAATPEPRVRITLCAALVKFDRFEWAVEKATELGVERIVPVETARSEKGLFEAARKRTGRWERIARESSQQARRVRVPEISPAVRFADALRLDARWRYFADEAGGAALAAALPPEREASTTAALLVGPEGGWTEEERQAAGAAAWQPVSLGPHILRAETAVTAGVAVLISAWTA